MVVAELGIESRSLNTLSYHCHSLQIQLKGEQKVTDCNK